MLSVVMGLCSSAVARTCMRLCLMLRLGNTFTKNPFLYFLCYNFGGDNGDCSAKKELEYLVPFLSVARAKKNKIKRERTAILSRLGATTATSSTFDTFIIAKKEELMFLWYSILFAIATFVNVFCN